MLLIGYLLLALVVAAVLFYLVVALLPSGLMVTPIRDNRPVELPTNRRLRISDLDRIRIPVSLRGYRFAETDELIDRLAAEIQIRDEEIELLRQGGAPAGQPAEPEWAVRELGEQAAAELAAEIGPARRDGEQPDDPEPTERPQPERPRPELPQTELPQTELPQTELPQTELPQTELPQHDPTGDDRDVR